MATLLKDFSESLGGPVPPWDGTEYLHAPANYQMIAGGGSAPVAPIAGMNISKHTILGTDGSGPNSTTGQRSELRKGAIGQSPMYLPEGFVGYAGFWQYLAADMPVPGPGSSATPTLLGGSTAGSGHAIAFQLHTNDTGSPKVALNFRNGLYSLKYDFSIPTTADNWRDWDGSVASPRPAIVRGNWVAWFMWFKIASDTTGFLEIRAHRLGIDTGWVTLFPKLAMATTSGGGAYIKDGYYRGWGSSGTVKETKTGTVFFQGAKYAYGTSTTDATFRQDAMDMVDPLLAAGASSPPPPPPPPPPSVSKQPRFCLVFVEENHSLTEMESGMPKLWARARAAGGAWFSNYHGVGHPSLRNYITFMSGTDPGWTNDNAPSLSGNHVTGKSVFDLALDAGRTAKAYLETMPSNNDRTDSGEYAVKHNPWAYFMDSIPTANANALDVPLGTTSSGALKTDITNGTLKNVAYVTPNLLDDAHDGSLTAADDWLDPWLNLLTATTLYQTGDLLILVTGDEDDGSAGNAVLTVALHPSLTGQQVSSLFDHKALCKLFADVAGVAAPGGGATAPSMLTALGLSAFDWSGGGGGGTGGGGGGTGGSLPLAETVYEPMDDSTFGPEWTLVGAPGASMAAGNAIFQADTTNRTVTARLSGFNMAGSHIQWRWSSIPDVLTASGAYAFDRCRAQLYAGDPSAGNFITIKALKTRDTAGTVVDQWHVIYDQANGQLRDTFIPFDATLLDWQCISTGAGQTLQASSDGGSTWTTIDTFTTPWAWSDTVPANFEFGERLQSGTATVGAAKLDIVGALAPVITPPSTVVAPFDPNSDPIDSAPWKVGDLIEVHITGDDPAGYPTNLATMRFTDASGQTDPTLSGIASSTARAFLFYKPYEPGIDTDDFSFAMSQGENWVATTTRVPNADVFAADNGVAQVTPVNWGVGTTFAIVTDAPNADGAMLQTFLSTDTDAVAGHLTPPSGFSTGYATPDSQVGGVGAAMFWKAGYAANEHVVTTFGDTASGGAEVTGFFVWIRPRQSTKSAGPASSNPRPKDMGYKIWTGPLPTAGSNFTAGVLRLRRAPIGPADVSFTDLAASVVTPGGAGLAGFYLFAYALVGAQLQLVALSSDMAALVKSPAAAGMQHQGAAAQGGHALAFAGGDPDAFCYLGGLLETADGTTALQLGRNVTNPGLVNGLLAASDGYAAATYGTGLTHSTIPTTLNLTDLVASSTDWWFAAA